MTGKQVSIRAMMKWLSQEWKNLTPAERLTWNKLAQIAAIAPYHAYIAANQVRWRNFLTPSKAYPATDPSGAIGATTLLTFPRVAMIDLWISSGGPRPSWGWQIHRSKTTGFTPSKENTVAFKIAVVVTWDVFHDTPLLPGTYYYRVRGFDVTGRRGNFSAEVSGTVT
jgi:hypothetical protein